MRPPRAGMGRPKGSKNKSTAAVKTLLLAVNEKLGGEKAMLEWAKDNPTEFYKLLGRLIPQEVSGPDGGDIPVRASLSVGFIGAPKQ
jgi:hypothetical protein